MRVVILCARDCKPAVVEDRELPHRRVPVACREHPQYHRRVNFRNLRNLCHRSETATIPKRIIIIEKERVLPRDPR